MSNRFLHNIIRSGCTVALADGAGAPTTVCSDLSDLAREVGGVRLITGWLLQEPPGLDFSAFADVRTFMAGYGNAAGIDAGVVRYVPATVSQLPALLAGPWRPDVVIISARPTARGLAFGSEVSWIATAVDNAEHCLVEVNEALPAAARIELTKCRDTTVIAETNSSPISLERPRKDEIIGRIGTHLAGLVPPGAAVQFGPGAVGEALVTALDVPVQIDSGIVTDSVVDLDQRGLLLGAPLGTYLVGSRRLYEWADGRRILDRIEVTHEASRLSRGKLIAVNTALEIDLLGQVNVESLGARRLAGAGGHPDYAMAGSRAVHGLSIIALPTVRRGRSTLVDSLRAPVSTPRWAVDIVVTEHGTADLRGLTDEERTAAINALYR